MRRLLLSLALAGAIFLVCFPVAAQIFQDDGNSSDTPLVLDGSRRNRFSVSGEVLDAASGQPLQKLQVTIRSDGGGTFYAALTDEHGRFSFVDLTRGTYTVSATLPGYLLGDEHVEVTSGPVLGVLLKLDKIAKDDAEAGSTVSAHELKAPSKAREEVAKGEKLLFDKGDPQGSIRQLQKAIKEFPGYYEAYTLMGIAYSELKDTANAETTLRKAVELSDGKYPRAYLYLAKLYSDNRRYADAEPIARKALDLDANYWQADSELSRALVGQNQLAEAEKITQAALTLQPSEPELYVALINIHAKIPNYPALLLDTDMYLKLAPDGRAAPQIRAMRDQVRQALSKAPPQPQAQKAAATSTP